MEIDTTTLERVQAQLSKLQQDQRNLKLSILILSIAMFMLPWITERRGRTWIEAESFVIKDEHGVMRGMFSTIGGDAYIVLNGADGKVQADMRVAPFGSSFALYPAEGKGAVRLSLSPRGTTLSFIDAEQKPQMTMTAGPKGTVLKLSDEEGRDRITLGTQSGSRGTAPPHEHQSYSLIITDKDGRILFAAPPATP